MRVARLLHAGRTSNAGSASVLFAITLPVLLGATAFGVDLGVAYLERRSLQSAADAAALAAVVRPEDADGISTRLFAEYGQRNAEVTVTRGEYRGDPNFHRNDRFVSTPDGSALRVRASLPFGLVFGRILGLETTNITVEAEAAVFPVVSLSAGSRLASVDPVLLEEFIGPLFSADLKLTALDYRSLLNVRLDLGPLLARINSLSDEDSDAEPKASEILSRRVRLATVFSAMAKEMDAGDQRVAAAIMRRSSFSAFALSTTLALSDIIELDERTSALAARYPASALHLQFSALEMLAVAVRQNGIGNAVDANFTVPGVTSLRISAQLGEAMKSVRMLITGGVGSEISTDQVRLRIEAQVGSLPGLDLLDVPLELVAAGGQARVLAIKCSSNPDLREVWVSARPGLMRAEIGKWQKVISEASVLDRLDRARILNSPIVTATAAARVAIEQSEPVRLVFRGDEIGDGTIKTARTRTILRSLASDLARDLRIDVRLLGLGLSSQAVSSAVATAVSGLLPPLDAIINAALAAAGAGIGELDIRLDDLRCDRARLVG